MIWKVCKQFFIDDYVTVVNALNLKSFIVKDFVSKLVFQIHDSMDIPASSFSFPLSPKSGTKTKLFNHSDAFRKISNYDFGITRENILKVHYESEILRIANKRVCKRGSQQFQNKNKYPAYPIAAKYDTVKELHYTQKNIILVAENEKRILKYLCSLKWLEFGWNSEAIFIIFLYVDGGNLNNYEDQHRFLLSSIWKEFRLRNVILIELSEKNEDFLSKDVFRFNPFTGGQSRIGELLVFDRSSIKSVEDLRKCGVGNFKGYPLKVTMFERQPTVVPVEDCINSTVKYEGLDAFFIYTLAYYLNFTLILHHPIDGEEYGYLTEDGSYTGMLGDIIYGKADISMNALFIKTYGAENVEFTDSAYHDKVCVIVPKGKKIPKWLAIFTAVNSDAMSSLLIIYFVNSVIFYTLKKIHSIYILKSIRNDIGLSVALLEMLRPFVSSPFPKIPKTTSLRIFFGACLLLGLILTSSMQGIFFAVIANPYYYPDINTLEALDKSNLKIYTSSPSLIDTFGDPSSSENFDTTVMNSLSRKVSSISGEKDVWEMIAFRQSAAAITRKSDFQVPQGRYQSPDGSALLHLMQYCPRSYLLGYLIPKGSPYLHEINRCVFKLVESGLFEFHKRKINTNKEDSLNVGQSKIQNEKAKVFSFEELQIAFYILIVGWICSILSFILEYIFGKKSHKKKGRHFKTVSFKKNYIQYCH
ncbi:Ionotropic receptor 872 [Blattella germanica]|nr:Ionotropic receptor 872 [Blattella germanica]